MTTEPQTETPAFSPSDAAMEGFRLMRRYPGTIVAWSGIYFLGIAIIGFLMLLTLGPKFMDLARKGQFMLNDPQMLGDALAGSWPAFFLVLLLTVLLSSIMTGGVFRLVMRPEEKGLVHLRVGPDEFRLVGANLLLIGIGVLFLVAGFLVAAVAYAGGPLVATLSGFVVLCAGLYVGVRLSLVTPMTFDLRKLALREGWELTRGRFWPLFGMIVLAVVFYVMTWMLVTVVAIVVGELSGGEDALAALRTSSLIAIAAGLLLLLMQLVLQILQMVMIYGPFAVAYAKLREAPVLAPPTEP
jgi:hypothetical protein